MGFLVYIPEEIGDAGKRYLLERGYNIKMGTNKDIINDVKDCDAILTRSNTMITREVIQAAKNLKIIAKFGVGLDNIDIEAATENGVYVTNTPESNANIVAEHVMAFLLGLSKHLIVMDREMRKGNFLIRHELLSYDLEEKTLGLIGLGRIGKLVAKKAYYGFGMKVIAYDPYINESIPEISMVDHINEIYKSSDFISLHVPLTEETRRMVGKNEFNLMNESAFFINVSRGDLVDESALIDALQNNKIAGAAVDVFEQEPPEATNQLFTLDNVIVSPHSAALSKIGAKRMAVQAAMQVDKILRGESPDWLVNQTLLYEGKSN